MKTVNFSESIAACDLKDADNDFELIKVSVEGQGYFSTLAKGHLLI